MIRRECRALSKHPQSERGTNMNPSIREWAKRHGVSVLALDELRAIFGLSDCGIGDSSAHATGESRTQSEVRLEAARKGVKLFRNNVGVLMNERGVPIRFGLANDSKQLNAKIKSADLIGWRPVLITPSHVGYTVAQFVSRECKHPGWKYSGTDREIAQLNWAQLVTAGGGDATFCTGEGTL